MAYANISKDAVVLFSPSLSILLYSTNIKYEYKHKYVLLASCIIKLFFVYKILLENGQLISYSKKFYQCSRTDY